MLHKKTLISAIRRRDDDQNQLLPMVNRSAFTEWLMHQENTLFKEVEFGPAQGLASLTIPMLKRWIKLTAY